MNTPSFCCSVILYPSVTVQQIFRQADVAILTTKDVDSYNYNMFDKEIIDDFIKQLEEFDREFDDILEGLAENSSQPKLFEEAGMIVDKIYGAISMFGLEELSTYARTMKEVCYKCSRSESEVAQKKVYDLLNDCQEYVKIISANFENEDELKKLNFKINLSTKKAEKLLVSYFHSIKDGSVSYDADEHVILVFDKSSQLDMEVKESKKLYVPQLKFHNARGGFKKDLKSEDVSIAGIIVDTSCSSNLWMEAIREAHESRPAVPIILLSQNPKKLEVFDQANLGVKSVLKSKSGVDNILNHLKELKRESEEALHAPSSGSEDSDDSFIEVSSTSFKLCLETPYDIFIKVGDKYIKVVEKGNSFSEEQLKRQYDKGVYSYQVRQTDYNLFIESFKSEISRVLSDPDVDVETKKIHFSDFGEEIFQSLESFGVDDERLETAKGFIEHSDSLLNEMTANSRSVQDLVMDLSSLEHTISVCFIIGLFLKEIGAKKDIYDDIMLAGFFHDIGLIDSAEATKSEVVEKMSEDEKQEYYDHPKKGSDLLRELNLKPAVIEAVLHHHIRANGEGFPAFEKGTANTVNRIGELIGIAEEIAIEIRESSDEREQPIEKVRLTIAERYSPTITKAFNTVFPLED